VFISFFSKFKRFSQFLPPIAIIGGLIIANISIGMTGFSKWPMEKPSLNIKRLINHTTKNLAVVGMFYKCGSVSQQPDLFMTPILLLPPKCQNSASPMIETDEENALKTLASSYNDDIIRGVNYLIVPGKINLKQFDDLKSKIRKNFRQTMCSKETDYNDIGELVTRNLCVYERNSGSTNIEPTIEQLQNVIS